MMNRLPKDILEMMEKDDEKKGGAKILGKGVPEEQRELLEDFFEEEKKVSPAPVGSLPGSLPSWRGTGSSCVYPQQQLPPR